VSVREVGNWRKKVRLTTERAWHDKDRYLVQVGTGSFTHVKLSGARMLQPTVFLRDWLVKLRKFTLTPFPDLIPINPFKLQSLILLESQYTRLHLRKEYSPPPPAHYPTTKHPSFGICVTIFCGCRTRLRRGTSRSESRNLDVFVLGALALPSIYVCYCSSRLLRNSTPK
jgi:hypothetical protein